MSAITSIKNNSGTFFVTKYCVLCIVFSIAWCAQVSAKQTETLESKSQKFETIEWVDLIPQADLAALLNPPQIIAEIPDGSPEDIFGDSLALAVEKAIGETQTALSPEDRAYYSALVSATDTDVTQEIEVNIYILADNKQQAEEKGDAIAEQIGEVTGFTQVQIAKDQ